MKKLTAVLLALTMMLALTACTGSKDEDSTGTDITTAGASVANEEKTLVAYFTTRNSTKRKADADSLSSASEVTVGDKTYGNAELLAKYAADAAGADVFSIETAKAYDEDYNDALEEAQEEQNRDARPELKETVSNMEDYDTIVLIYPMWWGDMPMVVRTFLESYDFSGKTIYPISTHGGSGMGSSVETIKRLAKGATVKDGLAVSGNSVTDAEADVRSYLG